MSRCCSSAWYLLSLVFCLPCAGQGITDYLNFESPQVKALAVATLNATDYLLVCNTPDNSVEIYRASDNLFVARVPVGQEPVSVVWDSDSAVSGHLYTCNFIGDSMTRVEVVWNGTALEFRVDRTLPVGDEPMNAVVHGDTIYVSLNTTAAYAYGPKDLSQPLAIKELTQTLGGVQYALAQPRAMVVAANKLYILAFRGHPRAFPNIVFGPPSCSGNGYFYTQGYDLYIEDLVTHSESRIGNLGTTNFNMVADSGSLLVVSADAQTHIHTEAEVRAAEFGFVRSFLHRISVSLPFPSTRDLNEYSMQLGGGPVDPARAICQPTDLVSYRDSSGTQRVFVASFGTDRIAVVGGLETSAAGDWTIDIVELGAPPAPRKGPRCLAVSYGSPATDLDDRVFALNRFTNSMTVVNPNTLQVTFFPLQHDPVPQHIRSGQSFLYDGLLSGSGMVSCASCHIDGRLDARSWNLGGSGSDGEGGNLTALLDLDPSLQPGFNPPHISAQVGTPTQPATGWDLDKGAMATQSLQGLLNWEVEAKYQRYVTNAPYHWRGDRIDFTAFRAAFVNLMDAPESLAEPGLPQRPTAAEMTQFETFINSIAYPPNPEQPRTREYAGDFGDPNDLAGGPNPGSGAQLGLKAFHTGSGDSDLNCSSCHSLPEGSNNRITTAVSAIPPVPCAFELVVNENAALRGVRQKENQLVRFDPVTGTHTNTNIRLGPELGGLIHSGTGGFMTSTMDDHIAGFFSGGLGANVMAVIDFVRQLDTGTAPLVGSAWTCDLGNKSMTRQELAVYSRQAALGNVGLVVQAWFDTPAGPVYRGFRYLRDLSGVTKNDYVEELPTGPGAAISVEGLLSLVNDAADRLIVQCTPLGSDRRLAHPSGQPPVEVHLARRPSQLVVLPMEPNIAHWRVPLLTDRWDIVPPPGIVPIPDRDQPNTTLGSLRSLAAERVMQRALVSASLLPNLRHEPPRRFLIAGVDIRSGATLEINIAGGDQQIVLPLYPTGRSDGQGRRVWTTAVELEPREYLAFMMGGDAALDLPSLFDGTLLEGLYGASTPLDAEVSASRHFAPAKMNRHRFTVINADGTRGRTNAAIELSAPSAMIPKF